MVRDIEEAVAASLAQKTNVPGTCQKTTRGWYDAPSAGDRDGDGDADAVDGWLSEPKSARHTDRNPPRGAPVAFSGGSQGFGHRAQSHGDGRIRSTDMSIGRYKRGVVGFASIAEIERSMGVKYLGWSRTIDGIPIPGLEAPAKPKSTPPPTKPTVPEKPPVTSKSATFKIATANIQSLPHLKSVSAQLKSLEGIQIGGLQEVDPKDYKQAVLKKFPHAKGVGTAKTPANETYSTPVIFGRVNFNQLKSGTKKVYDGESGISYTRRLTYQHVEHKKTSFNVGHVNLHSVLVKADRKEQRLAMRAETKTAVFAQVRHYMKHGMPVVITGDFNDKANWFGKKFDGQTVLRVGVGIDQIILIASDKLVWDVLDGYHIKTPSDHDTIVAKVSLTEK